MIWQIFYSSARGNFLPVVRSPVPRPPVATRITDSVPAAADGHSEWGPQHEVRIVAYCHLIEKYTAGTASFGVILFAGTCEYVIIPNTNARQVLYDRAFKSVAKFLERQATVGVEPPGPPTDGWLLYPQ